MRSLCLSTPQIFDERKPELWINPQIIMDQELIDYALDEGPNLAKNDQHEALVSALREVSDWLSIYATQADVTEEEVQEKLSLRDSLSLELQSM